MLVRNKSASQPIQVVFPHITIPMPFLPTELVLDILELTTTSLVDEERH